VEEKGGVVVPRKGGWPAALCSQRLAQVRGVTGEENRCVGKVTAKGVFIKKGRLIK